MELVKVGINLHDANRHLIFLEGLVESGTAKKHHMRFINKARKIYQDFETIGSSESWEKDRDMHDCYFYSISQWEILDEMLKNLKRYDVEWIIKDINEAKEGYTRDYGNGNETYNFIMKGEK